MSINPGSTSPNTEQEMKRFDNTGGYAAHGQTEPPAATPDRSIGDIIRQTNNLTPDQVERVLAYQREHNLKFGEAAVALGFAKREDVLWALSQQFNYPYTSAAESHIHHELVVANKPFSEQAEVFRRGRQGIRLHGALTAEHLADLALDQAADGFGVVRHDADVMHEKPSRQRQAQIFRTQPRARAKFGFWDRRAYLSF